MFNLFTKGCLKNQLYELAAKESPHTSIWLQDSHKLWDLQKLRVGEQIFFKSSEQALFTICAFQWRQVLTNSYQKERIILLKAVLDLPARELPDLEIRKEAFSLAVITLSDKGSQALREDTSGPTIVELLKASLNLSLIESYLIPDDKALLKALLADLACNQKFDLICTTGGTGLGPRDISPEVTASLLDQSLPGFTQAMMAASLAETPNAILSRACAGLIAHSIVINLPGSPKAVRCNLKAILPALKHAIEKANGDLSDCGGQ